MLPVCQGFCRCPSEFYWPFRPKTQGAVLVLVQVPLRPSRQAGLSYMSISLKVYQISPNLVVCNNMRHLTRFYTPGKLLWWEFRSSVELRCSCYEGSYQTYELACIRLSKATELLSALSDQTTSVLQTKSLITKNICAETAKITSNIVM